MSPKFKSAFSWCSRNSITPLLFKKSFLLQMVLIICKLLYCYCIWRQSSYVPQNADQRTLTNKRWYFTKILRKLYCSKNNISLLFTNHMSPPSSIQPPPFVCIKLVTQVWQPVYSREMISPGETFCWIYSIHWICSIHCFY